MKKIEYEINKAGNKWVIWKMVEIKKEQKGSFGCYKVYSGKLDKCREYAKKHKLKIKRSNNLMLKLSF